MKKDDYQWNSLGLFSTPLIKIKLDGASQAKDYFYTNIYGKEKSESNIEGERDANHLSHFHHCQNMFTIFPELSWLQIAIENAASFAYQELLNYKKSGELKIINAWINLCDVGASQASHTHANSLLSGTFYLNTDSQSNIKFYHPLTAMSLHPELYDAPDDSQNEFNLRYHHREIMLPVSVGECLFWPSQLQHGYVNNQTPKRLSLSFNLMPKYMNNIYQVTPQ